MRLDRITLTNLRAFEHFELALDERLTLLVGRNGSGKSTVLDGIAVALGAWVSGFKSIKEDHPIDKRWARLERTDVGGVAGEEARFPVRVEATGEVLGTEGVSWARELRSVDGRTTAGEATHLRNLAHRAETGFAHADTSDDLPLVAYYGTGRLWVQKRDRKSSRPPKNGKSRLAGYRAALEAASDHKSFEAWMARQEADRIQRLARASEEGRPLDEVKSPLLEAVGAAACACLEGAVRFHYSASHQELRVDLEGGLTIPFADLSDGQRNLIAVAADIAWRATQLNPQFAGMAPVRTAGVVLIDEVELHLHPAWQRRVLDDLLRAFPCLQFVCTTHSPQVMSSAPPGAIRLIDRDHEVHRVEARGKTTNVILEDVLGVQSRPQSVRDAILELYRLIEDGELAVARARLQELEADAPGPDDPDLVAARWELEMAEGAAEPDA